MKKTTQTWLPVLSTLLLLISVTQSAQGQPSSTARFTGAWNVITDQGEKLVITLWHDRSGSSAVVGSYQILGDLKDKPLEGELKGTVTDNVLRFTWSSDPSRRAGRFTLSADGDSFEGTYSPTRNPEDTSGGTWKGTRVHSFAGAWQGKLGESFVELILQQSGDQVTGEINLNSVHLLIVDGIVQLNTLRFTVMRNKIMGKPEYAGTGELVMDRGGKSFTGTILGAATSGNLVGRPSR